MGGSWNRPATSFIMNAAPSSLPPEVTRTASSKHRLSSSSKALACTGGRLRRLRDWLDGDRFMCTYGDGVGNIDITRLVEFHRAHKKLATVTAVRPPARFGGLVIDGDRVREFYNDPR